MRAIKLIKNAERKTPETRSRIKSVAMQNSLHKGIRAWVIEFKRTSRGESLIAFDSLFKDAVLQSGQIEKPAFHSDVKKNR
jgi:hypothetical protein